jgi:hypothetical protein
MSQRAWWIGLLGAGATLIGLWGTWVPHRATALVLSGWDLTEYVKFLPGTSATRESFYLPVWCAGATFALMAFRPSAELVKRIGLIAVALSLMIAIAPPYPHLVNGYRSPEFRWQFALSVSGVFAVVTSRFSERLPGHTVGGMLVVLALVGALPALWQFLKVRAPIEAVYGADLGWGWGIAFFLAGWITVGTLGGWHLLRQSKSRP